MKVALFQPEIPGNTGNIIRLCANTGTELHLIEPLGFDLDDARLRRAGLDYHEWAAICRHRSLTQFLESRNAAVIAMTTKSSRCFFERKAKPGETMLFGPETRGLPTEFLDALPPEDVVRLPMQANSRSLNLSNAVAIAVYETWRQLGFPGSVRPTRDSS